MRGWLTGLLVLLCVPVHAQESLTVEDLIGIRLVSEPRIDPAGDRIVYVLSVPREGKKPDTDLWMVATDGGEAIPFTVNPGVDQHPRWSPDGRWIAFLSARPTEESKVQVHLIPTSGGEARALTAEPEPVESLEWTPDGKHIIYSVLEPPGKEESDRKNRKEDHQIADDVRHRHLKLVSVATGECKVISPAGKSVFDFAVSPQGNTVAAFLASKPGPSEGYWNARLVTIDWLTTKVTVLSGPNGSTRLAYSPDGKEIAFLSSVDDKKLSFSLAVMPSAGGTKRLLCPGYQGAIRDFLWSPSGKSLFLWAHQSTTGILGEIAAGGGRPRIWFQASLRASSRRSLSMSRDGRWLAYWGESPVHPPEVYLLSRTRKPHPGRRLTFSNPLLEDRRLGRVEKYKWKADDGLEIHGLLVHPVSETAKGKTPTVVMVHGGPQWHWWHGWLGSWHEPAQLLAARGYRVLLPNPRGSGGRGVGFASAAHGDWGGMDFKDVMKGVDKLIAAGLADGEHLGIIGWSYGGYMAAWAVTQTNRFKASVAGAAVTNLLSMQGTCDIPMFLPHQFDSWPYREPQVFLERSPVFWAHKASTPTLLVHGEADVRVPVSQAREMAQALKEAGVETRLITFPREGHAFEEPGHQRVLLTETIKWLDEHLRQSD